jgi:hypothetical protein
MRIAIEIKAFTQKKAPHVNVTPFYHALTTI